MSLINL